MTEFEPANYGITTHYLTAWLRSLYSLKNKSIICRMVLEWLMRTNCKFVGIPTLVRIQLIPIMTIKAGSGNRTRTSCLEGKGTTIIQYLRNGVVAKWYTHWFQKPITTCYKGSSPFNFKAFGYNGIRTRNIHRDREVLYL